MTATNSMTTMPKSGKRRPSSQLASMLTSSLKLTSIWRLLEFLQISQTHRSRLNLMHHQTKSRKSLLAMSQLSILSNKIAELQHRRLFLKKRKLRQCSRTLSSRRRPRKMQQLRLAPSKSSASSRLKERTKTLSLRNVSISPIGTRRPRRKMLRSNSFRTSRPGKLCLTPGSTIRRRKCDYIHNCQVYWHKNNFRDSK
jgi:hypothetical protein